jgi:hypothetical protein
MNPIKIIITWWEGKWRDSSLGEILGEEDELPNIIHPWPRRVLINIGKYITKEYKWLIPVSLTAIGIIIGCLKL